MVGNPISKIYAGYPPLNKSILEKCAYGFSTDNRKIQAGTWGNPDSSPIFPRLQLWDEFGAATHHQEQALQGSVRSTEWALQ